MIACVTLPFYALMQMQDGIARSYNWVQLALLPLYVIRHLVMLAMVAAAYLLHLPTDAVTVVVVLAISLALTAIGQTLCSTAAWRANSSPDRAPARFRHWFAVSLPMLMVGGFYLLLTHTDILVLQQFRPPDDVAIYYAASKTIALVSFVYFAVSAAVAHRFTEYHVTGDRQRLAEFLADSIRWTFWPSARRHGRDPADGQAAAGAVRCGVRRGLSSRCSSSPSGCWRAPRSARSSGCSPCWASSASAPRSMRSPSLSTSCSASC